MDGPRLGSETRVRGDETDATNGGRAPTLGCYSTRWSYVQTSTKVAASSFKFSVGATTPARKIGTREG